MTTLLAVQGDGWSVIGADSRASDEGGRYMELSNSKIVDNNGILIAVSGASRGGNIVQQGWKPPKPRSNEDLDLFITRRFIPEMREQFIKSGYDGKDDGEAAWQDSNLLISVRGVIYPIFNDYSWDREERGIYYGGSGGDVAVGALEALEYKKAKTPEAVEKLVYKAIEIAIKHDIFTGGKIITRIQTA